MKNLIITVVLFLCFANSFANDPFDYNQNQINAKLETINKVEKLAEKNNSLETILEKNKDLADEIELKETNILKGNAESLPANIPAFWWGFCLGGIGILIVHLIAADSDQTKKALYGCLTSGVIGVIIYAIMIVIAKNATNGI